MTAMSYSEFDISKEQIVLKANLFILPIIFCFIGLLSYSLQIEYQYFSFESDWSSPAHSFILPCLGEFEYWKSNFNKFKTSVNLKLDCSSRLFCLSHTLYGRICHAAIKLTDT